jgi:predicted ATPase
MRLDELCVHDFKNLKDVTINFDKKALATALIGRNATAKSNLIEALVWIFRNLDLDEPSHFTYRLKYVCRDRHIQIDAQKDSKKLQIIVDGEPITHASFLNSRREYLPKNVFGYYSGTSKRLEDLFSKHQTRFYDALRKAKPGEPAPPRPLFYAQSVHSQYVLLAFFSFDDKDASRFLRSELGITGFRNATFILKQPIWSRNRKAAKDDIFWGAQGVVRGLLEELYSIAIAPVVTTETVTPPLKKPRKEEWLHLRVEDLDTLHKLASKYGSNVEFFKVLESTHYAGLIQELKIKVRKEDVYEDIELPELSEGEQQLLTVLGLLRFTQEEESLFLLDEPDTHLNPAAKLGYMELMRRVAGSNETSHVLIVTHDPLLIGGLRKEQVRIFYRDQRNKRVVVAPPLEDPVGMGVEGLLTSELFGLYTTLDSETERKLERKRELAVKKRLTVTEKRRLERLNEELASMGFSSTFRDPLYTEFVKASRQYERLRKPTLTPEEKAMQSELALKIITKLREKHT